jgi:molecular chaperone DnaK
VPQIEVTFDIDADGILNVSARDKATGREQRIVIKPSSGLSKEEVERMVREAREHEAEDRRRRELAEARNTADSLIYSAEKSLRDLGDKVPASVRSEVESKIAALRTAMQGDNVERIRSATADLSQAVQKIGATMYEREATGAGGPQGTSGGRPGDEDVVDGDFTQA